MPILKPPRGSIIDYSNPIARGLVGCWIMNEGTGDKVYDISGQGNDGTLTNMDPATDWVAGQDGTALAFDGNDDYILTANPATDFNMGTNSLSVVAMASFSLDQLDSYLGVYLGSLVGKGHLSGGAGYGLSVRDNQFNFQAKSASATVSVHSVTTYKGTGWHTVVGVFDRSLTNGVMLYVDGLLKTSENSNAINADTTDSAKHFAMGTRDSTGGPAYSYDYRGSMGHAQIYDRALSAEEINSLYFDPYQIIKQPDYHKNTTYFLPFPIGVHPFSSLLTHGGMQDFTGGINA